MFDIQSKLKKVTGYIFEYSENISVTLKKRELHAQFDKSSSKISLCTCPARTNRKSYLFRPRKPAFGKNIQMDTDH
jgi:hypothetical protein